MIQIETNITRIDIVQGERKKRGGKNKGLKMSRK